MSRIMCSNKSWFIPNIQKCFNFNDNLHYKQLNNANSNDTIGIWKFWLLLQQTQFGPNQFGQNQLLFDFNENWLNE